MTHITKICVMWVNFTFTMLWNWYWYCPISTNEKIKAKYLRDFCKVNQPINLSQNFSPGYLAIQPLYCHYSFHGCVYHHHFKAYSWWGTQPSFFTDKEIETCLLIILSLVDSHIQIHPAPLLVLREPPPWKASGSGALQTSGLVAISNLHAHTLKTASQE